jgi:hypothetical protein
MFLAGYKGWYDQTLHLNGISGAPPMKRAAAPVSLAEAAGRIAGELADWMAPTAKSARPNAAVLAAGKIEHEESELEFIVEPLGVPSAVRPAHEPHVLYVRLAAPAGAGKIAVLPDAGAAIAGEIALGIQHNQKIARGVIVGADSIVEPRALAQPGHEAALGQLVAAIRAFTEAGVPFVWRTRGGLDGPLPPVLATALVEAGRLAVVELGVPTLDATLTQALEGHEGATPAERIRLATALASRGVVVRGLVDPLVPMLTDQQQGMEELMSAFAEAGVHKVGARYIVLTRERARAVAARLAGMQRALLQGVFADEPWHKPDPQSGAREVHKRIPAHLRRAGHHRLLEAGARHGIFVDILDPVAEGDDLTDASRSRTSGEGAAVGAGSGAGAGAGEGDKRLKKVRRRPQLELFRKSSSRT